jgi:hypothetical protein
MCPLSPELVFHADSGGERWVPLRANLELLRAPSPTTSLAAGSQKSELLLLLLALFLSCCCRPPHQAATVGEGPGCGASAGLAAASCASREVVGPVGFASSICLSPAAAP